MHRTIRTGVFDWCHFARDDSFYPADLPADWRLDFYRNEFDSACVSLECLLNDATDLLQACTETDERSQLSLHLCGQGQFRRLLELCAANRLQVQYLILEEISRETVLQNEPQQQVLGRAGLVPERILPIEGLWRPDETGEPTGPIALFPAGASLRDYRSWIEQWLKMVPHEELTLWFRGGSADYRTLEACKTLVGLMGFA